MSTSATSYCSNGNVYKYLVCKSIFVIPILSIHCITCVDRGRVAYMFRSEERWYAVSTRYGGRGVDHWDDGLHHRVKEISLPSGCTSRSEERRYVVSTRYGGRGGDHWDDGLYHRVKEITLRCGKGIDSFCVLYDKDNEQIQARAHGGNGGRVTTITFGSNEFLKTVSGHYGVADWTSGKEVVIRSIKFETNKTVYGPYGEELGNDRFNLTVKDGDKIIGFFGRSGKYLDAIGFHVETHP